MINYLNIAWKQDKIKPERQKTARHSLLILNTEYRILNTEY